MTPARDSARAEAVRSIGWDDPATARYYAAFCNRHARYRIANEALAAHAGLEDGRRVLDVAAGIGGTSSAALSRLRPDARLVLVEPSAAMRARGEKRLRDPRVTWVERMPEPPQRVDRILCGAAVWLLLPLPATFGQWRALLEPGGTVCFDMPAMYAGEPDEPGGGRDPLLLELPAVLAREGLAVPAPAQTPVPSAAAITRHLRDSGFDVERFGFRLRFTQRAYRDWLKIPVLTEFLLHGLDADERARRIDAAFDACDPKAWRWERWTGWKATLRS